MSFEVRQGDCVELMAAMPAGSVDAICTDPPYGLEFMGKDWDRLDGGSDVRQPFRGEVQTPDNPYGRTPVRYGYDQTPHAMQEWHQAWAIEALRVLKPGGHLLAFGGTRTYHRLVCAVEDAGFEIRDTISWLYGSGFPKSLDVGKAIDRHAGRIGESVLAIKQAIREAHEARGLTLDQLNVACGFEASGYLRDSSTWVTVLPDPAKWKTLRTVLELDDSLDDVFARAEREVVGQASSGLHRGSGTTVAFGEGRDRSLVDVTASATPEAERWEGWGTALKPAHEPVVVARKPLAGTVSGNVLEHGTGALNVDGCRVGTDEDRARPPRSVDTAGGIYGHGNGADATASESHSAGRWPANVVLSHTEGCVQVGTREVKGSRIDKPYEGDARLGYQGGAPGRPARGVGDADGTETVGAWSCTPDCPVRLLDEQTGEVSVNAPAVWKSSGIGGYHGVGEHEPGDVRSGFGDSGGASRFFPTFKHDTLCVLCSLPLVESAGTYSPPSEPASGTVPGPVRGPQPLEQGANDPSSGTSAKAAAPSSSSTPPTSTADTPTAPPSAGIKLAEWIVLLARSAENLCDSCATATARNVALWLRDPTLGSLAGLGSTLERRRLTLSRNLALIAAGRDSTGITPTTADLRACFGSALAATQSTTPTSATASESDLGLRLKYQSKASRGERNAGLEGFEEQWHQRYGTRGQGPLPQQTPQEGQRAANHHPTVKPISLMRWLVRLVTPPNGVVLDPFAGSGTTGCAAVLEGFDFIGLEREPEYVKIAEARIAWWHKHRGDGEAAEILAAGELRDSVEATGQGSLFDEG